MSAEWWARYCAKRWPPVRFTIHAADGRELAEVVDVDVALRVQRAIELAEDVRRKSDGVVIATKSRTRNGESFYQSIWNLAQEPRWEQ